MKYLIKSKSFVENKRYIKLFEIKEKGQIELFVDYMMDSYSEKNGTFDFIFQRHPLTRKIIREYVYDYVEKRKKIGVWGGGDSFDREIFRDILRFKLGLVNLSNVEYDITPYLTQLEIDVNKYNL